MRAVQLAWAAEAMKKVLIVDDHRGAATGLSVAVQFDGRMTPLGPAPTVESALSFVDEADIVVLDLTLVDSEGAETVQRFKAGAPEDLPVVVYSALDEQALAEASQGIADATVVKGNVNELLRVLADLLKLPART
jgi:DNA-binding NarL/FixJ family response regulator